ncbi:phage tail fiber C-terminal domain-containing protein, partial [Escherichia coli]
MLVFPPKSGFFQHLQVRFGDGPWTKN